MPPGSTAEATLGGGCFWCTEAVFLGVNGVIDVKPGYAGGSTPDPDYRSVCTGETGHAEVVRIRFDPRVVGYEQLLQVFFAVHDPTTLNRQGADVGTQYRSVVFAHDDAQARAAADVIAALQPEYRDRIVTAVEPLRDFHEAEPEHHRYFERHPAQGYCMAVVAPKVHKFRRSFPQLGR